MDDAPKTRPAVSPAPACRSAALARPAMPSASPASSRANCCASSTRRSASSRPWCARSSGCSSSPPGFRNVLGVSIMPPYETYVLYEVYVTPGLAVMIQLFNGMQSSLSMVYDREVGSMRVLLDEPLSALVPAARQARRPASPSRSCRSTSSSPSPACGRSTFRRPGYLAGVARPSPRRPDARRDRAVPVLAGAPARKLRQRDELRDLPDVLRLLRALPALAHPGGERAPVPRSASPIRSPTRSSWCGTPSTARSSRSFTSVALATTLAFFVLAVWPTIRAAA